MITVIYPLTTQKGFQRLKRNLNSLEQDWNLGMDFLCVTNDKNLYLEAKNYLLENIDRGECLVAYSEKDNLLKGATELVELKNRYTYVANENLILPHGTITKLYKDLLERPEAGFISGVYTEYPTVYWVKDIYGLPQYIYSNEKTGFDAIMDIDTIAPYGFLTKTQLFKELYGLSDLDGYGGHSYGIRLRRQGYKNYIDTGVEFKDEGDKQ